MLGPFDHALLAILALGLPAYAFVAFRRGLMRATPERLGTLRRRTYLAAMARQWILVAAVGLLWLARGRAFEDWGFTTGRGWGVWVAWSVATGVVLGLIVQAAALARRAELHEGVRRQLGDLWRLVPHTGRELTLWYGLSATAGVCEEALYRGYLLFYLRQLVPDPAAAAASALLFGLGHAYQGAGGVLKTAALGLLFAVLYLLSGSLLPLIVIHALVDAAAGRAGYLYVTGPGARSRAGDREAARAGAVAAAAGSAPGIRDAAVAPAPPAMASALADAPAAAPASTTGGARETGFPAGNPAGITSESEPHED